MFPHGDIAISQCHRAYKNGWKVSFHYAVNNIKTNVKTLNEFMKSNWWCGRFLFFSFLLWFFRWCDFGTTSGSGSTSLILTTSFLTFAASSFSFLRAALFAAAVARPFSKDAFCFSLITLLGLGLGLGGSTFTSSLTTSSLSLKELSERSP